MEAGDGVAMTVDTRAFSRAVGRLASASRRSFREVAEENFGLALDYAMRATPPGDFRGRTKATTGKRAVRADLANVFVPVRIKGVRREEWPDVERIHDDHKRRRWRTGSKRMRPVKGSKYYVDRKKLLEARREAEENVGRIAANWLPGLRAVRPQARIPAFIGRHAGRHGGFSRSDGRGLIRLVAYNDLPRDAVGMAAMLNKRVDFALRRQAGKMVRRAEYLIGRDARAVGFLVRPLVGVLG